MGKIVRKGQIKKDTFSKEVTTPLDSTDDTDIIESSVIEPDNECDFIKRGKIDSSKRNYALRTPIQITLASPKGLKSNCNGSKETNNALKFSLTKAYGLLNSQEEIESLGTPGIGKNFKETDSVMRKLVSTLKKTPDGPYLSKSKLQNIQEWLRGNNVETVRTPPFANLSVTPTGSFKKEFSSGWKDEQQKHEESSLDSEVEGVLKAVYGEDWKQDNIKGRPKTEPRMKSKFFSPSVKPKMSRGGGFHSVRRNILSAKKINSGDSSDEENKLDDSVLSGIKMINLDSSYSGDEEEKQKILRCHRKKKKRREVDNMETCLSSVENLKSRVPSPGGMGVKKRTPKSLSSQRWWTDTTSRSPKKTFLASLSVSTPTSKCHPDAQRYKVNFRSKKDELVTKLYKLYNGEVFDGKLAEELNFSWNAKLRGTAGYCYNKRITKSSGEVIRLSRIEFSTKIVDRADRLRDTMIHELCHAASWMIDGVLDGHGEVWTKWASKAMSRFPELPQIKRCHNYDIVSKYLYRCTGCGYSIKRHSKSINTDRKRCGHCYGVLELLINRKRKGKGEVPEFDTTRTLPTPNKFALFVKENYHSVKSSKASAKHSEIMKALSEQYALIKNGTVSAKKLTQD